MEKAKLRSYVLVDDGNDTRDGGLLEWLLCYWKFAPPLEISTAGSRVLHFSNTHS